MDLNALRSEIDRLDDELLALFLQRMRISEQVARHKLENGLAIYHPAREQEVIARMQKIAGPAMAEHAGAFFTAIMNISKDRQRELMDCEQG